MKVNPLYILLLLLAVFSVVFYKANQAEERFTESGRFIFQLEKKANTISELRNSWQNPADSRKKIDSILRHPFMGKSEINRRTRQNKEEITIKKVNKQALDMLSGKILNETLKITKLSIVREDKNTVTVQMEIEL